MRRRALGKTGLEVSELALGTWGLSGEGYGAVTETEQDAVIERALAFGVTLFETADSYGKGAMEKRLGEKLPPSALVATKVGTDLESAPARKRFDATYVKESVERSRERLKRDSVDIVLLHNPSQKALERGEAFDVLRELCENKTIKTWGVSVGSKEAARTAVSRDVPVLELAYNAFHPGDLKSVSLDVKNKGVGVLARSVLSYGLLCGMWPATKEFAAGDHRADRWTQDELRRRITQLNALRPSASGGIAGLRAVALRYVLSNELVSTAVLGPRRGQQLDQLVREAGKQPPYLPPENIAALERRLMNVGIKP
jgi:aryl-alcohol dehydrogenase-like predicted oxidoreductase